MPDMRRDSGVALWAMLVLIATFLGVGVFAQVYRCRYVSGVIERQQTKWVALAFVCLAAVLMPALCGNWHPRDLAPWRGWALLALVVPNILTPVAIAMSVLRYRLWDVDVLINRARLRRPHLPGS